MLPFIILLISIFSYFILIKLKKQKKDYDYYNKLPPEKYEKELKLWFKSRRKYDLNLEKPKNLNEKIQWLKIYDATPLKTELADKYLFKEWVSKKFGKEYIIPLLGVWDSFDKIDFNKLPNKFILKATHGSGWNYLVNNKSELNFTFVKNKFDQWMKTNFAFVAGFELQYLNIKPRIIAEEYNENSEGELYDYKVYCFDGRVESIAFLSGKKENRRIAFFDTKWNKLNYNDTYPIFEYDIPKPKKLNLMIEICEKASKGFSFVRVDLYILNDDSIKLGELTFTPTSGQLTFTPYEQINIFGDMIKLPIKSPFPKRKINI